MNTNQHLENHYRSLCHKLNEQVYLLEKMLKKKKIEKKAIQNKKKSNLDPVGKEDADVDNDGKKNTSTDKYIKNRREKISQEMKKKKSINEGYAITDGNIFYGGFPKKLNENATRMFNDADDRNKNDEKIATHPDEISLENLQSELSSLEAAMEHLKDLAEPGEYDPSRGTRGLKIRDEIVDIQNKIRNHPKNRRPAEQTGSSFFARRPLDPDAQHDRYQGR